MTHISIQEKILLLKEKFKGLSSPKEISLEIMNFSKMLPPMAESLKTPEAKVQGCQSTTHVSAECREGLLYIEADSDALISRGIAAIFVFVYSGQPPETILKTPPEFAKELGILSSLSPTRVGGLISLFSKIKISAAKALQAAQ